MVQVPDNPPVIFITLLCCASPGFLLDERGIKMSKSIGNVVDPRTVMLGGKDQKQVNYNLNPSSSEVLLGGSDQKQVPAGGAAACTHACLFVTPYTQAARVSWQSQHLHVASHAGSYVGSGLLSCCERSPPCSALMCCF